MPKKIIYRIALKCLLLLAVLYIVDLAAGSWLENSFYKQHHGDDYVTIYSLENTKEDVLVFGSSRASHHYKTQLLNNLTNHSFYNCGRDEMTIVYSLGVIRSILKRYHPKLIILEVLPTELGYTGTGNKNYERIANVLRPFAHKHPELYETIGRAGKLEVIKTSVSKIYSLNSRIGSIIQNTYTNLGHTQELGYEALWNKIDSSNYTKPLWGDFLNIHAIDTALVTQFHQIIDLCRQNNIKLITVISPLYFKRPITENISYKAFKNILAKEGLPFLDYSQDTAFLLKPGLFNDDVHLNDSGATIFSTKISAVVLKSLNK